MKSPIILCLLLLVPIRVFCSSAPAYTVDDLNKEGAVQVLNSNFERLSTEKLEVSEGVLLAGTQAISGINTFSGNNVFSGTDTFTVNLPSTTVPTVNALYANAIPKVVGYFTAAGAISADSIGISSITLVSTGIMRINFSVPFAVSTYTAVVTGYRNATLPDMTGCVTQGPRNTTSIQVTCFNSVQNPADPTGVSVLIMGRQ